MKQDQELLKRLQAIADEARERVGKMSREERAELEKQARKQIAKGKKEAKEREKKFEPTLKMTPKFNEDGTVTIEYDVNDIFVELYKRATGKKEVVPEELVNFIISLSKTKKTDEQAGEKT